MTNAQYYDFSGNYGFFGLNACQNLAISTNSQSFALEFGNLCVYGNLTGLFSYPQYPDVQCTMRCGESIDLVNGTLADAWKCGGMYKQAVYQLKM